MIRRGVLGYQVRPDRLLPVHFSGPLLRNLGGLNLKAKGRVVSITPASNDNSVSSPNRPTKNIFEDPAIAAAAANDPFARWVLRNWKSLLMVLVVGAVFAVGYNRFSTARLEKRASATQVLGNIQDSFEELVSKEEALAKLKSEEATKSDPADKESLKAKIAESSKEVEQLKDKISLMSDALDSPPPFDMLGKMYKGLLLSRRGDFDGTAAALSSVSWEQVGKPQSSERFIAELLTLGLSRSLIDSQAHRVTARAQLLSLAERGSFAAVQAANALQVFSDTPEEKEQAKQIISGVRVKFPAQQKFLSTSADGE